MGSHEQVPRCSSEHLPVSRGELGGPTQDTPPLLTLPVFWQFDFSLINKRIWFLGLQDHFSRSAICQKPLDVSSQHHIPENHQLAFWDTNDSNNVDQFRRSLQKTRPWAAPAQRCCIGEHKDLHSGLNLQLSLWDQY